MPSPCSSSPSLAFLLGSCWVNGLSGQTLESLWITEVRPSTGEVEVTNVGEVEIVTSSSLPFCHRFDYGTVVPSGTSFAPGQSRIYTTNFSNAEASDLWIYSDSRFGNSDSLLNGLKWGSSASIGRTGLAVNGGNWDATASFVPTPPSGQSLLLVGSDPFSAANWAVGPADLGNFAVAGPPVEPNEAIELEFEIQEGNVMLSWAGGNGPFEILAGEDLDALEPLGAPTNERNITIPFEGGRQFFRVREAQVTATFEVTIQSAWSSLAFASVPNNQQFSQVIGASHEDGFPLWQEEGFASPAFEQLVEDGEVAPLISVVNTAIAAGEANSLIQEAGITTELGSTTFEITVNQASPNLSLVSALQPSPDWFVGVSGLSLLDESGAFVSELEVDLEVYDAGTDSGAFFDGPNIDSLPQGAIALLGENPNFFPSFFTGFEEEIPGVASLRIRQISE